MSTASPASVRKIADPAKRAAAAARLWAEADAKVHEARKERDAAATHLLRNEGWTPIDVYTLAGLSRRLFGPIAATSKDAKPGSLPVVPDAERVLKRNGKDFWRYKERADEARSIRAEAVEEMLAAGRTNADVARASGLSTARIAQVRRGE